MDVFYFFKIVQMQILPNRPKHHICAADTQLSQSYIKQFV